MSERVAERAEAEVVEGRATETWRLLMEQLEPRIEGLRREVEGMRVAPSYVWVGEQEELADPVEELRVKVEALRWMLRIAKHLNGVARDLVIGTVCRSAQELESAVRGRLAEDVVKIAA